jgi:hypothetical protein
MPSKIEDTLKLFNRKERYWVVRTALGSPSGKLAPEFCEALNRLLDGRAEPLSPDTAWWAIDYHFDWLQAALLLHPTVTTPEPRLLVELSDGKFDIQGQQEDVDLVVAHGRDVILIEAKAFGSWSNSQLTSKLKRLKALPVCAETGLLSPRDELAEEDRVRLHFVLMSPNEPQKLDAGASLAWPEWGKRDGQRLWIELQVEQANEPFVAVSRCMPDGKRSAGGTHWRLLEDR